MSEFITDRFSDLLVRVVTVQGITSLLLLTGVLWFVKKAFFPSGYVATLAGPRAWPFPLCVITYFRAVSRHGGVHSLQQSFYHQYGKICRMLSPTGSDKILVADPEIIKQILVKEFHRFPERGMPIKLVSPLDSELFMSEYSRWKRLRKVLSPTFSAARLKEIVPLVSEACDRLETKIGRLAATGESADVEELLALYVLDVILSANFGVDTKELQANRDVTFLYRARRVFSRPLLVAFLGTFPFLAPIVGRFTDVLGNAGMFIRMAEEVIKQRRERGSGGRRDVVQHMLEANIAQVNGESKLSDIEMSAASLSFLVAGFDTTYNTLSVALYFLTTNPHVQEKLFQEIEGAKRSKGDVPFYDLVQSVRYLEWVLLETLRLVPIGYRHFRQCVETVEINGVLFSEGVRVEIPSYALHRDPEIWPEPEIFDPERFSPEEESKRHPFSYLPFGQGPRICIGQRLAMLIMKVALVKILEKYQLERTPETRDKLTLDSSHMLKSRDAIAIKFVARKAEH